jgi:hypothetical protein
LVCGLLALATPRTAQAQGSDGVDIEAAVSPKSGTTDDQYQLTVQIKIAGIGGFDRYLPPDLSDWVVLDQGSFQQQWISATQIGITQVRTYTLSPRTDGLLPIGQASVVVGGATYQTRPLQVQVKPGSGKTASAPPSASLPAGLGLTGQAPPLFLRATADRSRAVVGQQITITWKLYTLTEILSYDAVGAPSCNGFFTQDLALPTHLTYDQERIGGQDYLSAVVLRRAVFPLSTGSLTVGPMDADVQVFGTFGPQTVRVESPGIAINAEATPSGAPASFDPANVGSFDLVVEPNPAPAANGGISASVGQAIEVAVSVRGSGNLPGLAPPSFGDVDGFKVYQDHVDDPKIDPGDVVRGEKVAHWIFVPQRPGNLTIPGLTFAFYDPDQSHYATAHTDPVSVVATGQALAGGQAQPAGAGGAENVLGPGIRPIHNQSALQTVAALRLYRGRLFLLLLAVPLGLYLLLVFADWLRERLQRETVRARLRRARGRARRRLRAADVHIRSNRPEKFFGEISKVLTDHIEERLGEPVAGMTRDDLRSHLEQRGFPPELVEALSRELENCDFARFASSASGPGEMRAALRRVRAQLGAIERVHPKEPAVAASTKEVAA